ncbi:MAG: bifunctional glycosyltransferase family 2/GtrA family protein [Clostridia bacterium]|nr:bifunctional glycosyltransferase family 2/GtrA family protein [Clostridia bacterium]
MSAAQKVTVVLPSLNPDEKLRLVVEGLCAAGFDDIIIVNDGSDAAHLPNFPSPDEFPNIEILTHPVNRGKGAALKTAFAHFLATREGRAGVVTVDGDNQHHPADVLACAEVLCAIPKNLILGVRDFSGPDVPARSRKGNRITSFVFRAFCGLNISDTQTGLRAIPAVHLPRLMEVEGDRFEYETNMLLELKRAHIKWTEVPIRTVYIEENQTSHFRPIVDSWRIYKLILKFILSSGAGSIVDIGVFYLLALIFGVASTNLMVYLYTAVARLLSSLTNFTINRNIVFRSSGNVGKTLVRYYALAIPQLFVSAFFVDWLAYRVLHFYTSDNGAFWVTVIKAIVDTLLFFISFRIQREWVFRDREKGN